MPELPEVETLRRSLEPHLLMRQIERVEVIEPRLRQPVDECSLRKSEGRQVVAVERRAKYLIWRLEDQAAILIHLGMSGRLGLFSPSAPLEAHTHVIFHFDHLQVRYRDPRRFGLIKAVPSGRPEGLPELAQLGPEPLSDEFNASFLAERLQRSAKPIKHWLMDAHNVVGVGNIYANEALFDAGIHPQRPTNSLSAEERKRLVRSIKAILAGAIEQGGTTLNDYRNAEGEPGFFQMRLQVYHRAGEPCPQCGASVRRIVMSNRSTFYCPNCQSQQKP